MYKIKTEDVYEYVGKDEEMFGFSILIFLF